MAMTVEQVNNKLSKILKQLDAAIDNRNLKKVKDHVHSIQQLNKNSEGQHNDSILQELEQRVTRIVEERNEEDEMPEKVKLQQIRKAVSSGEEPFRNAKKVVENLVENQKDFNENDLYSIKNSQKVDNEVQINALKQTNEGLETFIIYIEDNYIEKIESYESANKIIEKIKEDVDYLKDLDEKDPLDTQDISKYKASIKSKLADLKQMNLKGVDVSVADGFEADLGKVENFIDKTQGNISHETNVIANKVKGDTVLLDPTIRNHFNVDWASNNADNLTQAYKKIVQKRQKASSKIATLQAENRQIDKTMEIARQRMQEDQRLISIAETPDGSLKSDEEIINNVLENKIYREDIDRQINEKYNLDSKYPWTRMKASFNYYREQRKCGIIRAAWNVVRYRTRNLKMLVTEEEALDYGKTKALKGHSRIDDRNQRFRENMKQETLRRMVKNPNLSEEEIKDDVVGKAYESVFEEGREDH